MTAPILQKMEQRRLAKGNLALYNLLDREIRQDCRTAKETMLTEQCQVIEQLDAAHKSNLMHSRIKLVTGRKRGNNTTTCIEDKNGEIIMEKDKIIYRWSEYIGELYNDANRGDMPDIATEVESPITRREVEHALRGMQEKKSPGPDGITTEMLVAAGEIGILELTELSNMIHNQGSFPNELNKSIFITLPNVNGTIKCKKHNQLDESCDQVGTTNCYQQNFRRDCTGTVWLHGFRIGGTVVNNLRYADDTVIISESEEQLQRLINVVVTKNEEKGLYLNSANSFTMVYSKASQIPTCNINVHGKILEQVYSFVYLGSQFTSDARCEKEIRRRIWIAKSAFTSMSKVLTSKDIHMTVRIKVLRCYVWSTLLYGCETWTISVDMQKK